jgi:inhibitor of cysteine peptidase
VSELVLTQADSGRTCEVHPDDVIVVRLEENPTTGYVWAVDKTDEEIVTLQSSRLLLPQEPKIGEGGTRVFTFRAETTGTASIHLKHWREWEGDASIIERFDITLVVGH